MTRINKYETNIYVQGEYGFGWEDLCCENTWSEARSRIKEYRDNEPGTSFRLKKRRELKE